LWYEQLSSEKGQSLHTWSKISPQNLKKEEKTIKKSLKQEKAKSNWKEEI